MADTQDSVEILLKKARERRARNQKAESALLQREKTGAEKMCQYLTSFLLILPYSKFS